MFVVFFLTLSVYKVVSTPKNVTINFRFRISIVILLPAFLRLASDNMSGIFLMASRLLFGIGIPLIPHAQLQLILIMRILLPTIDTL